MVNRLLFFCLIPFFALFSSENDFQKFLDEHYYTLKKILRFERMFGTGFINSGGLEATKELLSLLELKPNQTVLDVGCGIGGTAFYISKNYSASVKGIDLSKNMIGIAFQRASILNIDKVSFDIGDISKIDYPENSFDVIFCRDTIRHVRDKDSLLKKFNSWLKPKGKLLIADYCCDTNEKSEHFKNYIAKRNYYLLDPKSSLQVIENAQFQNICVKDKTDDFVKLLIKEKNELEQNKKSFIDEFSKEDYMEIKNGWEAKIARCQAGEQKWVIFTAEK
ncbi:MAG: methyltransferase domain-containing protein [Chlamydiae bacterium]|nr:methyltransferase domain-containing protein [Chlamydiota bacterium]